MKIELKYVIDLEDGTEPQERLTQPKTQGVIDFPSNHRLALAYQPPLLLENRSNRLKVALTQSPSTTQVFDKVTPTLVENNLANGINFRSDPTLVEKLLNEFQNWLTTPSQAFKASAKEYEQFLTKWCIALLEHEITHGMFRLKYEGGVHGLTQFQTCRLATSFREFLPAFKETLHEKLQAAERGGAWEEASQADGTGKLTKANAKGGKIISDFVLEKRAGIENKRQAALDCVLLASATESLPKVTDDGKLIKHNSLYPDPNRPKSKTLLWSGDEALDPKVKKLWAQIWGQFHYHRIRYIVFYNGVDAQLFFLKSTTEVHISPIIWRGNKQSVGQIPINILTLLVALSVVLERVTKKEENELFLKILKQDKTPAPLDVPPPPAASKT